MFPSIPQVLPAPNPWVALLYLIPSAIMTAGVVIKWRRVKTYPVEIQQQARIGTLRFALLTAIMFTVVLAMIKL